MKNGGSREADERSSSVRGARNEAPAAFLFAGKLVQIGFDFTDLIRDDAFQVAQVVEDLTFEIEF